MKSMEPEAAPRARVDFSRFDNSWFSPGRGLATQALWYVVNAVLFQNPLSVSSRAKVGLLRLFGAKIGKGVVIKPSVNIKYPWRLELGDFVWLGEGAWLDSLSTIKVGSNVCISQGTYFCTGNHDWTDPHFGLVVRPIVVEDGVWVGARATILPGVTLRSHSVIAAGSVVAEDSEPYTIHSSWQLRKTKQRTVRSG